MRNRSWILRGFKLTASLMLALQLAAAPVFGAQDVKKEIPQKVEMVTGKTVYKNAKASVDASNLSEGYVLVRYLGARKVKLKVQIAKAGGTTYTYDLNSRGTPEAFPLTLGDGSYTVSVFENISGTKYSQAYSTKVTLKLRNEFLPFLYPNQYVNFTMEDETVKLAEKLSKKLDTDISRVKAVYDYVTGNISYDYEMAKTVAYGYLPDVDTVLARKKGICFDYAAVMSAMLRSQGIPCKLVVGYVGQVYHAWISVYLEEYGWMDKLIYFDGKKWTMMDPTFAASYGTQSENLKKFIGDGKNYTAQYAY